MWTTSGVHDLTWSRVAITCTFCQHGFGGEEIGRFKDQKSADSVKKQLPDLSNKIDHSLQPVFKSREDLKMWEPKPPIISQQCVVYNIINAICVMQSMPATPADNYTNEHRYSAIGKYLKNDHAQETIGNLTGNFSVLKTFNGKLNRLIYEMLFAQNYLFTLVTFYAFYRLAHLYYVQNRPCPPPPGKPPGI